MKETTRCCPWQEIRLPCTFPTKLHILSKELLKTEIIVKDAYI